MAHIEITHYLISGGFALIGAAAGTFESALLASSRSRLRDLLEETKNKENAFLRRIADGDSSPRISAALLHALGAGGFLLYSGIVWGTPAVSASEPREQNIAIGSIVILLTIQLSLRALCALAGEFNPEKMLMTSSAPLAILSAPLTPLVWLVLWLMKVIARAMGHDTKETEEKMEERVIAAVSDGEIDGVVQEEQREMIEGIFDLKGADVADVFTPRTEMISVEAKESLDRAIEVSIENGHSRIPVHEETRDNVIGIFHVRDALSWWSRRGEDVPQLKKLIRKPLFIPETKKVSDLLREMQKAKTHMAIVLDEYGGTAGLVTIEDLLEEIVGEIQDEFDEFDENEEIEELKKIDRNTVIARGVVHVSDINEALEMDLIPEHDDYETVAGFVLDNLGHIPKVEEEFSYRGVLTIKVLTADERKIEKVRIVRDPDAEPKGS